MFSLLLALTKGSDWGWTGYRVLILLTVSSLLLALFAIVELHVERPLLDIRLLGIASFSSSLLIIGMGGAALFTVLFYIPMFMQHGQGVTPLRTGLAMLPEAIVMIFTLPIAEVLYGRIGPRRMILIGLSVMAFGTYLLAGVSADLSPRDVMLWTAVRGFGQALLIVAVMTAGLDKVPSAKLDAASALINVIQRVVSALGLALITAVTTRQATQLTGDRAALSANLADDPRVAEMAQYGVQGLLPYLGMWQLKITAVGYSNMFLLLTAGTLLCALTAPAFPARKPDATAGPRHLDIGM